MLDLPDMHVDDELSAYLSGLKKDVALQVRLSRPLNVQEADAIAQSVDEVFCQQQASQKSRD